jgi:hypothetical protein
MLLLRNRRYSLRLLFFVLLVSTILLSACTRNGSAKAVPASSTVASQTGPSPSSLKGLEAREALALANTWKTTEKGVTSFVDTKKISFEFENGEKASVPLPEAKMVVAIAPYINKTHPCETHYLSGCQGELVNVPIKVYGKTPDGLVVVDKTITTLDNGFFELWLGRDLEIDLVVEYSGRKATQRITTFKDSNTCITTMHL